MKCYLERGDFNICALQCGYASFLNGLWLQSFSEDSRVMLLEDNAPAVRICDRGKVVVVELGTCNSHIRSNTRYSCRHEY